MHEKKCYEIDVDIISILFDKWAFTLCKDQGSGVLTSPSVSSIEISPGPV